MPAPKPHDPRTPRISVEELREKYEHALVSRPETDGDDELAGELSQFEAAYRVLASALQDGE